MKIKRFYKVFLGFMATGMLALLVMSGCSNGKNGSTGKTGTQGQTGPLSPAPVITGLDPTMSSFNTVITITGENFATNPAVYCDGSPAMLMSSSATQITVTGCGMTNVSTLYQAMVSVLANNQMSNGLNEWIVPSGYIAQFHAASLTGPQGVVSGNGKLYVADNAGVFAVDNATGWTTKIVPACPTCTLSTPAGITMDNSGNLIVTDSGSNTLVGINPTTSETWYILGPGNGLLNAPIGVTYSNGDLYVANSGSSNVTQVNDTTLSAVNLTLSLALSSAPEGITADAGGNLYVACSGGTVSKIVVVGSNGTVSNSFVTGVPSAYGIGVSGTSLAVTSNANPNVYTAPLAGGAAAQIGCTTFPWESGTNPASSVISDGSNGLLVGDPSDGLIYHVNSACNVSTYAAGFADPYDIAYLDGYLYTVNYWFANGTYGDVVSQIRTDGAMKVFAQILGGPDVITTNPSGGLTVGGYVNSTVYTISSTGAVNTLVSGSGVGHVEGLTYDPSGNLYIYNDTTHSISKWDGSTLTPGFATGITSAYQIAFHNGYLYICDYSGHTIDTVNASTGGSVSVYLPQTAGFHGPEGIGFDIFGNFYIADYSNYGLFRVDPQGHVTALVPPATSPMIHPNGIAIPSSQLIYTVEEGSTTSRMWVVAP